jgi:hypothetical protein
VCPNKWQWRLLHETPQSHSWNDQLVSEDGMSLCPWEIFSDGLGGNSILFHSHWHK